MDAAERLSEGFELKFSRKNEISNYTYYNAKYSPVEGIDDSMDDDRSSPNISLDLGKTTFVLQFKTMNLTNNDHFYGLSVNTDYSAVYLPTILFEKRMCILKIDLFLFNFFFLNTIFSSICSTTFTMV